MIEPLEVIPRLELSDLEAEMVPALGRVDISTGEDPDTYTVHVTNLDTSQLGPFFAEIVLSGSRTDGERIPEVRIPVRGTVGSGLFATPRTLTFPPSRPGEVVSRVLRLSSRGDRPFVVDLSDRSIPGVELIRKAEGAARATVHEWLVRVTIPEAGKMSETLSFIARYVADDDDSTTRESTAYQVDVPLWAFRVD